MKRVGLALLRHVLAVLVLLVSALLLALPGIGFFSGLTPPPAISVGTYDAPTLHGDERRIAHGRLRPVGALRYLALDGDPVENGYAHGALVGDLLTRLEGEMLERFTELVPAPPLRHLLLGWVSWSNRGLAEQLSAAELHELAAMGAGYDAHHRRYGGLPAFTRGLQYQALHDASQYLIDNPLVNAPAVGCTAIALRGRRSADGALLVGRLFDFEGGEAFDRDKLVVRVRPDHGLGYLSVAWPGSLGAVTGFNEARLWVSLNAGLSSGQRLAGGRPITLVIRRVLAEAASIDEAIAIIEASDVGVSCAVLLADGDEDRAVVVEKGPSGCAVRKMRDDRLIVCNHFAHPDWQDDAANQRRRAEGTSSKRFARALELVLRTPQHDPASLLAILRDRRGMGGIDVGFGNRGTINAWIGAHLVLADCRAGVLWVCEPPHGLGRAWAFTLDGPVDRPPLPASPDAELHERVAERFESGLERVRELIGDGALDAARAQLRDLLALNPRSFAAHELHAATLSGAERAAALRRALSCRPAYPADAARIAAKLAAAGER